MKLYDDVVGLMESGLIGDAAVLGKRDLRFCSHIVPWLWRSFSSPVCSATRSSPGPASGDTKMLYIPLKHPLKYQILAMLSLDSILIEELKPAQSILSLLGHSKVQ